MSRKWVVLCGLFGLGVALGAAFFLTRDRIAIHAALADLRSGARPAVDAALEELYVQQPREADRIVVQLLMDDGHANHVTLIEALQAMGKGDVVPRPPRRRYAKAVLAVSHVERETRLEAHAVVARQQAVAEQGIGPVETPARIDAQARRLRAPRRLAAQPHDALG